MATDTVESEFRGGRQRERERDIETEVRTDGFSGTASRIESDQVHV